MVTLLQDAAGREVEQVWDPFCGSGVLPLEWLRMALTLPPGGQRRFAFERWPSHPAGAYEEWQRQQARPNPEALLQVWGSDIAAQSVARAEANARSLGVSYGIDTAAVCRWHTADFRAIEASVPAGTALLANPPYAVRMGRASNVGKLHAEFEELLRRRTDLRPVVLACGYRRFLAEAKLPWQRVVDTRIGGLNVSLLLLR
jgi:putative N6-adenine-specific DNA methylase